MASQMSAGWSWRIDWSTVHSPMGISTCDTSVM
jgi:hypothetical protein